MMDIRVGQSGIQSASAAAASSCKSSRSRTAGRKSTKQKNKIKKKLKYNPKEISSQILHAAKAVNASQVLVRAKGKVAALMRSAATGDYDTSEVRAALNHANRMVKCARLKVSHLEDEEQKKRSDEREYNMKSAKYRLKKMELQRKKRLHRIEEKAEVDKAEAKYMKEKREAAGSDSSDDLGVSLEMSEAACAYSEKKLLEKELRELEQDMNVEMSQMADTGGLDESAILPGADGGDLGTDLPDCPL